MALRQPININQENINTNHQGKSGQIQPVKGLHARAALGEVGNKLPAANVAVKKIGVVRPIGKSADAEIVKKENKYQTEKSSNIVNKNVNLKKSNSLKEAGQKISENTTSAYSSRQFLIIDPDECSKNEPQMVPEYAKDIYRYLKELEDKYAIRQGFLKEHETTPRMRAVLVNWLAEVALNFKTQIETFHLCVAIIDRYIQGNKTIGRNSLQLVGTAAMYIACKYEEMYIPGLEDFVYICDDTFTARQILLTEMDILKKLEFSLGRPSSLHFLRRYNKIAQAKGEHHTLGKYILELTLMEYELAHVRPSLQAAAACCLSIGVLNETMDLTKVWTPTMVHHTEYKFSDFRNVMISMAHLLVKAETSKHQIIRTKYSSSSNGKISLDKRLSGPLVRKLTSMFSTSKK